ncbi:DUF3696 domain-containing protein [Methylophilaceae bacterium]|nr:DUF3696 domain-containing protein [Methylophilaceae bacterium]
MDHHLSKIILENIQTIEEYTEIPIEPITILLGPNSAGKSAILDVLQSVIPTCLGNKNNWIPDGNEKKRKQILEKSFRNNANYSQIGIEYTYTSKGFDPDLIDENDLQNQSFFAVDPIYTTSVFLNSQFLPLDHIPTREKYFGQLFHPILNNGTVSELPSREPKDENKEQSTKILHTFTFSSVAAKSLEGYTLTVDDRVVLEFQKGHGRFLERNDKGKIQQQTIENFRSKQQKYHPDTFDIYYKNQKWVRWQKTPFSKDNNPIDYFERHTLEETKEVKGLRTRFKQRALGIPYLGPEFLRPSEAAGDEKFWQHWNHIILLTGYDASQDALRISSGQENLTPASRAIPTPEECVFLGSDIWQPKKQRFNEPDPGKPDVYPDKLMWDSQIKFQRNPVLQNLADSLASEKFRTLLSKYPQKQKRFICGCSSKEPHSYWIDCISLDNEEEMKIRYCPNCGKKVNAHIIDYVTNNQTNSELAMNVNYYLREDLLIDKGYQFDIDTSWLTDDDNLFNPKKWPILDADAQGMEDLIIQGEMSGPVFAEYYRQIRPLIRLLIKDAQGNTFNFEDIGSGVSYMLPVVISACDKANSIKFIQQPELHIHPALQSNLANIFIDTFEAPKIAESRTKYFDNFQNYMKAQQEEDPEYVGVKYSDVTRTSQFIIETHSEHLILRFLKRIKDSKKRKSMRPIKPENISLLYFRPDPIKNCTQIKRIRISEDGGFVDSWPDGFFTERYKDIFDEGS